MRIGVVFPQTEIGDDPAAIRDYAQAAEGAGYDHLLAYDHVVGADPAQHPGFQGGYTHESAFHEPLVLFSFLAAATTRLEFATGIIIAPQRQTVLLAKQAAALDVLSGGRLRLGLGIGWNPVEYEALGENFHNRGRRIEEQIELLRRLFTEPVVTYEGRWHKVTAAGLKPLPVQRPIPIWMGAFTEPAIRRAARIADGWFMGGGNRGVTEAIEQVRGYVREAGRDPATFGIEGRVSVTTPADTQVDQLRMYQQQGVSHLSVNTMGAGFTSPQQHIDAIRRFAELARSAVGTA